MGGVCAWGWCGGLLTGAGGYCFPLKSTHAINETIRSFAVRTLISGYKKRFARRLAGPDICFDVEIKKHGELPKLLSNRTFENGFQHNSTLVSLLILKIVGVILASQYASYCVLASPRRLTRLWDRYRISVCLQPLDFTESHKFKQVSGAGTKQKKLPHAHRPA